MGVAALLPQQVAPWGRGFRPPAAPGGCSLRRRRTLGTSPAGGPPSPTPWRGPGITGCKGALLHPEEAPQAGPQQATQGFPSPQPSTGALIHTPAPSSALRLPNTGRLATSLGAAPPLSPVSSAHRPWRWGTRPQRPPRGVHAWSLLWGLELASLQPLCAVGAARLSGQQRRDPSKGDLQMNRATHKKTSLHGCVYLDPRRMFPGNGVSARCWSLANLSG